MSEIKCLIFIEGYTIAIFRPLRIVNAYYYVFDSHIRDIRGLSVANGTSVLMQFDSLYELEKYIQVFYLEYREAKTYFQIQYIEITTTENQRTALASRHAQNNSDRNSTRMNKYNDCKSQINLIRRQKYIEKDVKNKETYQAKKHEINKNRKENYQNNNNRENKKRKENYLNNKDRENKKHKENYKLPG